MLKMGSFSLMKTKVLLSFNSFKKYDENNFQSHPCQKYIRKFVINVVFCSHEPKNPKFFKFKQF